jgi:hypothetical protein
VAPEELALDDEEELDDDVVPEELVLDDEEELEDDEALEEPGPDVELPAPPTLAGDDGTGSAGAAPPVPPSRPPCEVSPKPSSARVTR